MVDPAPGLFSTMKDWPSALPSCWATTRATTSVKPPGSKGTMTLTGRSG